jgi:hypothetical protein
VLEVKNDLWTRAGVGDVQHVVDRQVTEIVQVKHGVKRQGPVRCVEGARPHGDAVDAEALREPLVDAGDIGVLVVHEGRQVGVVLR